MSYIGSACGLHEYVIKLVQEQIQGGTIMGLLDKIFKQKNDLLQKDIAEKTDIPKDARQEFTLENGLAEQYKKIAQLVNNMIPVQWEIFYFNANMNDDGGGMVYFYYKVNGNDELFYSNNIPKDHNIDQRRIPIG